MSSGPISGPIWRTAEEIAALGLPGLPTTKRAVNDLAEREGWRAPAGAWPGNPLGWWRRREGRGGGVEYAASILPQRARAALALREARRSAAPESFDAAAVWALYARSPQRLKDEAKRRLDALDAVAALEASGLQRDVAMMRVAGDVGASPRTLYNWASLTLGRPRDCWLAILTPRYRGRETRKAELPAEALATLKADYLRLSEPSFASCWRRLEAVAARKGWTLPARRTAERQMLADIPPAVLILARKGEEALKRVYPAQRRDRSGFHALEAVNSDGHTFDFFALRDGRRLRPVLTAWQDLHSGKILSWRLDESENRVAFMLSFGDLVERYGIPDQVWLDNTRAAANKWVTGGVPNRFRFKVREDEPVGLMKTLGVDVRWTRPYSGQSKPIERAFRDFCDDIARRPEFEGAYTGNSPMTKPENYGARAVEWAQVERIVAACIDEHNGRRGRRSAVCKSELSFDEAFAASYAQSPIRKASAEQRRLWLLAVEAVKVRRGDATIHLLGNRYWAEFLIGLAGQTVTARFDPAQLHRPLAIWNAAGVYVGEADCIADSGFDSAEEARRHGRARRDWSRAVKAQAQAEKTLGMDRIGPPLIDDLVATQPPAPAPAIIRPTFGALALKPAPRRDEEAVLEAFERGVVALFPSRGGSGAE